MTCDAGYASTSPPALALLSPAQEMCLALPVGFLGPCAAHRHSGTPERLWTITDLSFWMLLFLLALTHFPGPGPAASGASWNRLARKSSREHDQRLFPYSQNSEKAFPQHLPLWTPRNATNITPSTPCSRYAQIALHLRPPPRVGACWWGVCMCVGVRGCGRARWGMGAGAGGVCMCADCMCACRGCGPFAECTCV